MELGNAIKQKREQLGMTQQELAEELYVSRQTVCRWENGTRCPDLIMAKKIALVLGISLDELIPEDGVRDYVPVRDQGFDFGFLKVLLSGMMLMLIGIFLYVADSSNMEASALCFFFGIGVFAVGLFLPVEKGTPVADDALPQRKCPQCGKEHDVDDPQCPHCGHPS